MQVTLTGSNVAIEIIETPIINSDTTIVNGGSYISSVQTLAKGERLTAYYRMSASVTTTLNLTWQTTSDGTAIGSETLLSSAARQNGIGRIPAPGGFPTKKFVLVVVNGAGADVTLQKLGYTVS